MADKKRGRTAVTRHISAAAYLSALLAWPWAVFWATMAAIVGLGVLYAKCGYPKYIV